MFNLGEVFLHISLFIFECQLRFGLGLVRLLGIEFCDHPRPVAGVLAYSFIAYLAYGVG